MKREREAEKERREIRHERERTGNDDNQNTIKNELMNYFFFILGFKLTMGLLLSCLLIITKN
jgi:hypothetical protein